MTSTNKRYRDILIRIRYNKAEDLYDIYIDGSRHIVKRESACVKNTVSHQIGMFLEKNEKGINKREG